MRKDHIASICILFAIFLHSCKKATIEEEPLPEKPSLFVAGYLPWYGFSNFDFEALQHIDRLYYFSIAPDQQGNFLMSDLHQENLKFLNKEMGGSDQELFLVLGGWYESETIFPMAENPEKRAAYTDSIVQFCLSYELDGVDLDWEAYPKAVPEKDYLALVDLLSMKLHQNKLKFTIAVSPSHHRLSAKFKDKADQLNLMSYGVLNDNGQQVTMAQLTGWLNDFDAAGVPRSQLIVGVPFYGKRPYDENDQSARALTYSTIVEQSSPAYGINSYGKYSFNGRGLMETKTKYLRQNNYYGIMAWELSQDVDYHSPFSLLRSIVAKAK